MGSDQSKRGHCQLFLQHSLRVLRGSLNSKCECEFLTLTLNRNLNLFSWSTTIKSKITIKNGADKHCSHFGYTLLSVDIQFLRFH